MKKKVVFIVQRYGLEVNGGAEYHCRVIAERLKDIYDVEVLTSCAKDYLSWKNEYPDGVTDVNGITVRRFAVNAPRNWKKFNALSRYIFKKKLHQKLLRSIGLLPAFEKAISAGITEKREQKWIDLQGPYIPEMVEHLAHNHTAYNALIFFTYLYYPTVCGLPVAPEKSILIPTAHDEPPIYLSIFKKLFKLPAAILYNTASEKRFVNKLFNNENIYSDIVGLGVEATSITTLKNTDVIINNADDYLIYIGRVDPAKGCKLLFDYFLDYKKATGRPLKLVVVGEVFMEIPNDDSIITTGFIDEDLKTALLLKAKALVMPSFYESLSLVTLESMANGVPVIANKDCEVLKEHVENSHAGFLFNDYKSFEMALNTITSPQFNTDELTANAKKYVADNYTWAVTIDKYQKAIARISPR